MITLKESFSSIGYPKKNGIASLQSSLNSKSAKNSVKQKSGHVHNERFFCRNP